MALTGKPVPHQDRYGAVYREAARHLESALRHSEDSATCVHPRKAYCHHGLSHSNEAAKLGSTNTACRFSASYSTAGGQTPYAIGSAGPVEPSGFRILSGVGADRTPPRVAVEAGHGEYS